MFSKILIANRGEIACRVIRTARRLGVSTVAVFSDADRGALHAELADEAVHIGGAAAAESYLAGDRIIDAALSTGAEAIHPGYGFLSENPDFVEAVEKAGLTFIGPSAKAIRAMGLKDAAKSLMEEADVPVVPGYHGEAQDLVVLAGKANEIGFPVLIKARAGGGGKGMRLVDDPKDFGDALSAAKREGKASFGDERVLVEKFVASPRHIEIQVFGDNHGNVVHLFERDCSLQRRHQKVIEEAPAPGMTDEMREAMGEAAVKAAKAIGYSGAGTVEFIVDGSEGLKSDRFYFMEMNTRLQVEHPVTESITGLDLVEWQLRVASGAPLPLAQEDLTINGWSFEARVYAEDAKRGFLPATGTLSRLRFPKEGVRVDSGVREGDTITPFYDPMIAKLIVHGPDRDTALKRMEVALNRTEALGTTTNIAFLAALCRQKDFAQGDVDTGLIDRELDNLNAAAPVPDLMIALAAVAVLEPNGSDPASDPFETLGMWSHWTPPKRVVHLVNGDAEYELAVFRLTSTRWSVSNYRESSSSFDTVEFELVSNQGGEMRVDHEGRIFGARSLRIGGELTLMSGGASFSFVLPDVSVGEFDTDEGGDRLVAPMPGVIKQMSAAAGQSVEPDTALIVMEAMKMELTLTAPRAGVIAEITVSEGDQVADGDLLLSLEPQGD
ncbi:acetyl/propionyl/methylcrotonyl-CoA carboxylase subunit alpha [Hoeflea prorocentri]|uniref:Acetyl/propionyl/methylcrotonyl-CoA carboxylase subunit alpha n=1 Tax=Hoeflea prorocentri TaxID=1922333 RepID=A0A9X3ZGP5_9HYPH|nr:acetyl/propionyl/methylcrotonyl-CoA carboxylase subunit alpha [Hoeflea prorocentri]MCY6380026.1 acetyl/propionyl/methylcrotonyl-CoA carboxylase subunit alpha [Hoeflea prorocentri]MDA5397826.1 acetyl/propionyl/methylcrotonyl-CoA carboxylase subunit alpha [Hoeflea prorocentri]